MAYRLEPTDAVAASAARSAAIRVATQVAKSLQPPPPVRGQLAEMHQLLGQLLPMLPQPGIGQDRWRSRPIGSRGPQHGRIQIKHPVAQRLIPLRIAVMDHSRCNQDQIPGLGTKVLSAIVKFSAAAEHQAEGIDRMGVAMEGLAPVAGASELNPGACR